MNSLKELQDQLKEYEESIQLKADRSQAHRNPGIFSNKIRDGHRPKNRADYGKKTTANQFSGMLLRYVELDEQRFMSVMFDYTNPAD